jgi:hypothetical protein
MFAIKYCQEESLARLRTVTAWKLGRNLPTLGDNCMET